MGEEAGGQHEQTGLRVGITGLTGGERRGMGVENRGPARMIKGQPGRMRLGERARCQLVHRPTLST